MQRSNSVEEDCFALKKLLNDILEDKVKLKKKFEKLQETSKRCNYYSSDDSSDEDPASEGTILSYNFDKERLDERLRELEAKVKEKNDQLASLDERATAYLASLANAPNSKETESSSNDLGSDISSNATHMNGNCSDKLYTSDSLTSSIISSELTETASVCSSAGTECLVLEGNSNKELCSESMHKDNVAIVQTPETRVVSSASDLVNNSIISLPISIETKSDVITNVDHTKSLSTVTGQQLYDEVNKEVKAFMTASKNVSVSTEIKSVRSYESHSKQTITKETHKTDQVICDEGKIYSLKDNKIDTHTLESENGRAITIEVENKLANETVIPITIDEDKSSTVQTVKTVTPITIDEDKSSTVQAVETVTPITIDEDESSTVQTIETVTPITIDEDKSSTVETIIPMTIGEGKSSTVTPITIGEGTSSSKAQPDETLIPITIVEDTSSTVQANETVIPITIDECTSSTVQHNTTIENNSNGKIIQTEVKFKKLDEDIPIPTEIADDVTSFEQNGQTKTSDNERNKDVEIMRDNLVQEIISGSNHQSSGYTLETKPEDILARLAENVKSVTTSNIVKTSNIVTTSNNESTSLIKPIGNLNLNVGSENKPSVLSSQDVFALSSLVNELKEFKNEMESSMSSKEKTYVDLSNDLTKSKRKQTCLEEQVDLLQSKLTVSGHKDIPVDENVISENEALQGKVTMLEMMLAEYKAEIENLTSGDVKNSYENKYDSDEESNLVSESLITEPTSLLTYDYVSNIVAGKDSQPLMSCNIISPDPSNFEQSILIKQNIELKDNLRKTNDYLKFLTTEREMKQKEYVTMQEKLQNVDAKMIDVQRVFDTLLSAVMNERDTICKENERKCNDILKLSEYIERLKLNITKSAKDLEKQNSDHKRKNIEILKQCEAEKTQMQRTCSHKVEGLSSNLNQLTIKFEELNNLLNLNNIKHKNEIEVVKRTIEETWTMKYEKYVSETLVKFTAKEKQCEELVNKNSEISTLSNSNEEKHKLEMESMKKSIENEWAKKNEESALAASKKLLDKENECENLTKKCDEMNNLLNSNNEKHKNELEEVKRTIENEWTKKLEGSVSDASKKYSDKEKEAADLNVKCDEMSALLNTNNEKHKDEIEQTKITIENEWNKKLEESTSDASKKLSDKENEIKEFIVKCENLTEKCNGMNDLMNSNNDKHKNDIEEIKLSIENEWNKKLEDSAADASKTYSDKEKEFENLKNKCDEMSVQLNSNIEKHKDEIEQIKITIENDWTKKMEQSTSDASKKLLDKENELGEMVVKYKELSDLINSNNAKNISDITEIEHKNEGEWAGKLEAAVSEVSNKLSAKENECEELEKRIELLNQEMNEFTTSLKDEMTRMKEDMKKQSEARLDLEVRYDTLSEDYRDNSIEKKKLEEASTEFASDLLEQKSIVYDLNEQIEYMTQKNQALTADLDKKESDFTEELDMRNATIRELQVTITNNLKQSNENYDALKEDMDQLNTKMNKDIEEQMQKIFKLERENSQLTDENNVVSHKLQEASESADKRDKTVSNVDGGQENKNPPKYNEDQIRMMEMHNLMVDDLEKMILTLESDKKALMNKNHALEAQMKNIEKLDESLENNSTLIEINEITNLSNQLTTLKNRIILHFENISRDNACGNYDTEIALIAGQIEELSSYLALSRGKRGSLTDNFSAASLSCELPSSQDVAKATQVSDVSVSQVGRSLTTGKQVTCDSNVDSRVPSTRIIKVEVNDGDVTETTRVNTYDDKHFVKNIHINTVDTNDTIGDTLRHRSGVSDTRSDVSDSATSLNNICTKTAESEFRIDTEKEVALSFETSRISLQNFPALKGTLGFSLDKISEYHKIDIESFIRNFGPYNFKNQAEFEAFIEKKQQETLDLERKIAVLNEAMRSKDNHIIELRKELGHSEEDLLAGSTTTVSISRNEYGGSVSTTTVKTETKEETIHKSSSSNRDQD